MSTYEGEVLKVTRKLDGKGRFQLPADFREAVGLAPGRRSGSSCYTAYGAVTRRLS